MTTRPWQPLRTERISRRSLLKGSSGASVGAAGLALVGCGDNDDETIRELLDEIDGLEDVFDEAQVDGGAGGAGTALRLDRSTWQARAGQSLYDDKRKPHLIQPYPVSFIEINPEDATRLEVISGDLVAVESDRVRTTDGDLAKGAIARPPMSATAFSRAQPSRCSTTRARP